MALTPSDGGYLPQSSGPEEQRGQNPYYLPMGATVAGNWNGGGSGASTGGNSGGGAAGPWGGGPINTPTDPWTMPGRPTPPASPVAPIARHFSFNGFTPWANTLAANKGSMGQARSLGDTAGPFGLGDGAAVHSQQYDPKYNGYSDGYLGGYMPQGQYTPGMSGWDAWLGYGEGQKAPTGVTPTPIGPPPAPQSSATPAAPAGAAPAAPPIPVSPQQQAQQQWIAYLNGGR